MNPDPLNILLLEDNATDAALEERELKKAGLNFAITQVETEAAFAAALVEFQPDIILADYSLPAFDGLSALDLALKQCPEIPFILVSGNKGEELAIEALLRGATDYVLKTGLHRLGPAVKRALLEVEKRRELSRSRERLRATTEKLDRLLADSPAVIYSLKINGPNLIPTLISENVTSLLGFTVAETLNPDWWHGHLHPEDAENELADVCKLLAEGRLVREYRIQHKDGTWRWIEDNQRVICDALGDPTEVAGVWTDITERKQAEAKIRERESQYRQLVEALPVALYTTDATGRILLYNSAAVALWGRKPNLETDRWGGAANIFEPGGEPLPFEQSPMAVALREERPVVGREIVMERPDGTRRNVMPHPRTMHDADGKLVGAVNLLMDITETKAAEASLRLRDSALRAAADAILITDLKGRIEWANPAFFALTGYEEEEVLGKTCHLINSGKHPAEFFQNLWDSILAGNVWNGEMINRRKDGTLYHEDSSITPVKNLSGELTHFIAIKRDITLQKESQREIEKLAAFPGLNPNPIVTFTAAGDLSYVNAATEELAVLADCGIPQLLPPNLEELIQQCLASGRSSERQETGVGKRTISWSYFPIVDQQIVHGYGTDVTERLLLEDQFRQSQKMDAIGQLSGGVAHDFNNLLSVIIGHAEMAQMPELTPKQVTESLVEITEAGNRAAGLTRQLLTFSRKQPMQKRSVNLTSVVDSLSKMLRRILGENIQLVIESDENLPTVTADSGMLEQVVMNLAINARDAMPEGGRLTISIRPETLDAEYVRLHHGSKEGSHLCLNVRDTGTGISKENQKRIFEPFFTTKEAGKGTGLGLATVFGIVKQHGGWIQIYSELGEGTLFRVYLPADAQAVATLAAGDAAAIPVKKNDNSGTETILLAEDEASVRLVARKSLERVGYRVLEAETGPLALEAWRSHASEIKLLLTDMIMPGGMNGRELAATIRTEAPRIRVIFSSGYATDTEGNPFAVGEDTRFLQKPYTPANLVKIVREQLDAELEAK